MHFLNVYVLMSHIIISKKCGLKFLYSSQKYAKKYLGLFSQWNILRTCSRTYISHIAKCVKF